MLHLRKPKSPVPTPLTPRSLAELVRGLASRKDPRALAVTSTAIALSLGFPIHDIDDTSSDGATIRRKVTIWKMACDGVRLAVDITKDSADTFGPLKAVSGALSVLILNLDVSESRSRTEHFLTGTPCPFPAPARIR